MTHKLAFAALLGAVLSVHGSVVNYSDSFNDTDAREHNWTYWGQPTGGGVVEDQPVVWMANGGVASSARVTVDLENTSLELGCYWPFYLVPPEVGGTRTDQQELNFLNHAVSAIFNTHGVADVLNGGTVRFFIGQYKPGDGTSAWYYHNTPFVVNQLSGDWSQATEVAITAEASQWTLLSGNASVSVSSLLDNPQQYGFVVLGASAPPTFNISMDNFSAVEIVPLPGAASIAAAAAGLLVVRRRRK